jgi:ligand-binding sensor domain-containing protein
MYPYRQYNSDGELINSNVHDMLQDNEGYIWFATENGLSRFDGSKAVNYGISDGLPAGAITALTKDNAGNIYAGTKRKGIYLFEDNRFRLVVTDTNAVLPNQTIVYQEGIFYSLRKGFRVAAANTNKILTTNIQFPQGVKPLCIYKGKNETLLAGTTDGIYKIENTSATKTSIQNLYHKKVYSITEYMDMLVVATDDAILLLRENNVIQKLPVLLAGGETIQNCIIDQNEQTWVSTSENKLLLCTENRFTRLDTMLPQHSSAFKNIMSDNEGNVWVSAFGEGVFCFYNMYCTNYTNTSGLSNPCITSMLNTAENSLFITTSTGIFHLQGNTFTQVAPEKLAHKEFVSLHQSGNKIIACKSDTVQETSTLTGIKPYTIEIKNASVYATTPTSGIVYGRWNNMLFREINGKSDTILLGKYSKANKINCIYEAAEGSILCGTNNGLYKIAKDDSVSFFTQKELASAVNCITAGGDGKLYVGTATGIVVMYDNKITDFWQIGTKNSSWVTALIYDNKGRLWAGTLSGLYLYYPSGKKIVFDKETCLQSKEVTSLAYNSTANILWVGTNRGLSKIDITKFDALKTFRPVAFFKSVRTQDATTKVYNELFLPHNRNNFTLRFSAVHLTNPGSVKFLFKIDDHAWEPATGRQVEFGSMPYGKHVISLVAENDRGEQGPATSLTVTIATPWWATWWFRILSACTVLGIAVILIRWRFMYEKKKQKEQLELQNKISELRHQALNASMNPHFIFNSLNSIQQFINTHNTEDASEYLGKFARLIRLQLNSGSKTYITLDEELDRLSMYLELEKIRFGETLNYTINAEEVINTKHVLIPNMILQPFVENALWHGILPMKSQGAVHVAFAQNNGRLKVTIDDDGIGIRESEKRKNMNTHRSLGMHMIQERIKLLEKLNGEHIHISVSDKADIDKKLHGTIVEIEFVTQQSEV